MYHYVWFWWSIGFLVLWLLFVIPLPKKHKKQMVLLSILAGSFGITQAFFVLEYWQPPSLFNLNQHIGIDIESLIYGFATAGIAFALHVFVRKYIFSDVTYKNPSEKQDPSVYVLITMLLPFVVFGVIHLFFGLSRINPIYSSMLGAAVGAIGMVVLRPDILRRATLTGLLFMLIYWAYFYVLVFVTPGYVEAVWNFEVITGITLWHVPLEELLFVFAASLYTANVAHYLMERSTSNHA